MKTIERKELRFIGCLKGISQYEVRGDMSLLVLELSDHYYLSKCENWQSEYNQNIAHRIGVCYGSGYANKECLGEEIKVI